MAMIDLLSSWLGAMAELGVSELSEQTHGLLLQVAGQAGPDVRESEGRFG
jgi:hypothetical protein